MVDYDILAARKLMSLIAEACHEIGLSESDLEKGLKMELGLKKRLRKNDDTEILDMIRGYAIGYYEGETPASDFIGNSSLLLCEDKGYH